MVYTKKSRAGRVTLITNYCINLSDIFFSLKRTWNHIYAVLAVQGLIPMAFYLFLTRLETVYKRPQLHKG